MYEMTIELVTNSDKCLYRQIYEHILDEIKKGKLLAGEKLPSTRSLAEYLQVARSTVDLAYSQLQAEGYIESRPHSGYYVNQIEELLDLSVTIYANEQPDSNKQSDLTQDVMQDQSEIKYDFSPHAVSLKNFPYSTWKRLTKNILVDANSEMFALGDAQGDLQLRTTISRYLYSSRGVNCRPEQVIIGAGNDYLYLLLEKILGRHVPIAMEEPTYRRAYQVFDSFAYPIQTIPMDAAGMDVNMLRQSESQVAYIMPSHQFPTGIVMPIGRRMELLKWAQEDENRYLIEDDYDSEFRYIGKPIPALQGADRQGKVIYMGTFSKSIAPAIRVGYMVLPEKLLDIYKQNCRFYACTVSRIDQKIINEFIADGYFERYLNKMRKLYKEKHDFLLEQLIPFEKEFALSGENAGLHILLTSRSRIPEQELLDTARKHHVRVYGISDACMGHQNHSGKSLPGKVLLGYGALDQSELEQGMAELRNAWKEYL